MQPTQFSQVHSTARARSSLSRAAGMCVCGYTRKQQDSCTATTDTMSRLSVQRASHRLRLVVSITTPLTELARFGRVAQHVEAGRDRYDTAADDDDIQRKVEVQQCQDDDHGLARD